jgi:vacuolar-type H+-ATPase subunit H
MSSAETGPGFDAANVDAAIANVLRAERDARDRVQRCAAEAEAIVEQAHERARRIARRAAHRSVRVQRWYAAMLRRQLDHIEGQQDAIEQASIAAGDGAARRRALEALAAQLTGART